MKVKKQKDANDRIHDIVLNCKDGGDAVLRYVDFELGTDAYLAYAIASLVKSCSHTTESYIYDKAFTAQAAILLRALKEWHEVEEKLREDEAI